LFMKFFLFYLQIITKQLLEVKLKRKQQEPDSFPTYKFNIS
jgi:hypothetical protein